MRVKLVTLGTGISLIASPLILEITQCVEPTYRQGRNKPFDCGVAVSCGYLV
jgi:hypothetical protein